MASTVEEGPERRARTGPYGWLRARLSHLVRELAKFGTVGAVAFVIDTTLFNLFYPVGTLTAKVLSTAIATTAAFAGNKFWTYRHRRDTGLAREYFLFFVFNAVGLLITVCVLGFTHYWLGDIWPATFRTRLADNLSGNVVGVGLATLFRFWAYRTWVFLPPGAPPVRPTGLPLPEDDRRTDDG